MPINECDCEITLPLNTLRYVRAFGPRMRKVLSRLLQDKVNSHGGIALQDIHEAIAAAWVMLEADVESRLQLPPPDMATVEVARREAISGEGTSIDDILDALP